MKPHRPATFTIAFPVGRGHPTPQAMLARNERDRHLREAAQFFPYASDREAARQLRKALLTYRAGAWRRDQSEALCPVRYAGTVKAALWKTLKSRDRVPGDRLIRAVLART
jgi:hypothetical protein